MSNPFSSSSTTKSNNWNQETSIGKSASSFTNPALAKFQTGLTQNILQGMAQAQQPLYGQVQIGQYLSGLNNLANASMQNLQANLARRGVGAQSGQMGQGLTDINLARQEQAGNFIGQLPFMNRQAALQASQMWGGLGNQLMSVAPRTTVSNQFNQGTSTGYQKQTMNPSIISDIGQTLGIAGQVMGMGKSLFGKGDQPFQNYDTARPFDPSGGAYQLPAAPSYTPALPSGGATDPVWGAIGYNPYGPQPSNLWWNQ